MKKLIFALTFLLMMGTVRGVTEIKYNCTENTTITFVYECPSIDCPTCPVLPNETIIIQNLTLPQVMSPNVTCHFDMTGFETALSECNTAKDDLTSAYITCDSNLTKGRMYENELMQKQNEINSCRADVQKTKDDNQTYAMYGVIGTAIVGYFLYQQKVKPSAEKRLERG